VKTLSVWALVVVVVVGGGVFVTWPMETWRRYDKNWQALAMTHAENHCAGQVLADNGFNNKLDDPAVDACVAASKLDNTTPNVAQSVGWFCQGIASSYPLSVSECVGQVEGLQIWGLQHGGYTWDWSDNNPRPVAGYTDLRAASREGREGDPTREEGRLGP
jgi:hypothetical protein